MTEYACDILLHIAKTYHSKNGCIIKIYHPIKHHCVDKIKVTKVIDNGTIAGYSLIHNYDTAYDITDGILVTFDD